MSKVRYYARRALAATIATTACTAAFTTTLVLRDAALLSQSTGESFYASSPALAKSTGGRSRSGSFKRTPSSSGSSHRKPSSNSSTSTSPSKSRSSQPSTFNSGSPPQSTYRNQPAPAYVPAPVYVPPPAYAPSQSSTSSESGGGLVVAIVVIVIAGVVIIVLLGIVQSFMAHGSGASSSLVSGSTHAMNKHEKAMWREVENDIVTITRLQVALLAIASQVQRELSQLVADADFSTPEGQAQHLQDVVLVLLRTQEYWSHARGNSQTVKTREDAERLFDELSTTERSKLSSETLTNVGGKVKRRTAFLNTDDGPASYIVVTLLVGTAHDNPLFGDVKTEEELLAALKTLSAVDPNYLMILEVLWSPQEETDSLTKDELVTEYSDLYQLA